MAAKTDMERVGFFKEGGYHTVGDPYKVPKEQFNESAGKGKQMMAPHSKTIKATQDGYFTDKFVRIYEGEALTNQIQIRRKWRNEANKKILGRQWVPASGDKKGSGLGSNFGTIGGKFERFNPATKEMKKTIVKEKNFLTNPGRKGTGYGYAHVTLDKYPAHAEDKFTEEDEMMRKLNNEHKRLQKGGPFKAHSQPKPFFDENPYKGFKAGARDLDPPKFKGTAFKPSHPGKQMAGIKAGGFDKYPTHSTDMYNTSTNNVPSRPVKVVNSSGKLFVPNGGIKSTVQQSIVNQTVRKHVTPVNYSNVKAITSF